MGADFLVADSTKLHLDDLPPSTVVSTYSMAAAAAAGAHGGRRGRGGGGGGGGGGLTIEDHLPLMDGGDMGGSGYDSSDEEGDIDDVLGGMFGGGGTGPSPRTVGGRFSQFSSRAGAGPGGGGEYSYHPKGSGGGGGPSSSALFAGRWSGQWDRDGIAARKKNNYVAATAADNTTTNTNTNTTRSASTVIDALERDVVRWIIDEVEAKAEFRGGVGVGAKKKNTLNDITKAIEKIIDMQWGHEMEEEDEEDMEEDMEKDEDEGALEGAKHEKRGGEEEEGEGGKPAVQEQEGKRGRRGRKRKPSPAPAAPAKEEGKEGEEDSGTEKSTVKTKTTGKGKKSKKMKRGSGEIEEKGEEVEAVRHRPTDTTATAKKGEEEEEGEDVGMKELHATIESLQKQMEKASKDTPLPTATKSKIVQDAEVALRLIAEALVKGQHVARALAVLSKIGVVGEDEGAGKKKMLVSVGNSLHEAACVLAGIIGQATNDESGGGTATTTTSTANTHHHHPSASKVPTTVAATHASKSHGHMPPPSSANYAIKALYRWLVTGDSAPHGSQQHHHHHQEGNVPVTIWRRGDRVFYLGSASRTALYGLAYPTTVPEEEEEGEEPSQGGTLKRGGGDEHKDKSDTANTNTNTTSKKLTSTQQQKEQQQQPRSSNALPGRRGRGLYPPPTSRSLSRPYSGTNTGGGGFGGRFGYLPSSNPSLPFASLLRPPPPPAYIISDDPMHSSRPSSSSFLRPPNSYQPPFLSNSSVAKLAVAEANKNSNIKESIKQDGSDSGNGNGSNDEDASFGGPSMGAYGRVLGHSADGNVEVVMDCPFPLGVTFRGQPERCGLMCHPGDLEVVDEREDAITASFQALFDVIHQMTVPLGSSDEGEVEEKGEEMDRDEEKDNGGVVDGIATATATVEAEKTKKTDKKKTNKKPVGLIVFLPNMDKMIRSNNVDQFRRIRARLLSLPPRCLFIGGYCSKSLAKEKPSSHSGLSMLFGGSRGGNNDSLGVGSGGEDDFPPPWLERLGGGGGGGGGGRLARGRSILKGAQFSIMLPNTIEMHPPHIDSAIKGWKKMIDQDVAAMREKSNRAAVAKAIAACDVECPDLDDLKVMELSLTKKEVDQVVGAAVAHALLEHPPEHREVEEKEGEKKNKTSSVTVTARHLTLAAVSIEKIRSEAAPVPERSALKDLPTDQYERQLLSEVVPPDEIAVGFDDIGALDGVKNTLHEVVILPLQRPELFTRGNLTRPTKGLLLFGPPGTGKTMLAKAVASESGAHFINVNMSAITSKWLGEGERLVRAVFSLAHKLAPSVIFIDEIDSFLSRRGGQSHEHEALRKMKTEFLAGWDGLRTKATDRVLVLAATNRPMDLDDAAIRRMPRRILVPLPDAANREKILSVILKDEDVDGALRLEELGRETDGYSGSDLKNLCIAAAYCPLRELLEVEKSRKAKRKGSAEEKEKEEENEEELPPVRPISMADFKAAMKQVTPSTHADSATTAELQRWNEQYGEGGSRRSETLVYFT